jgi:hypothetical protein
VEAFGGFGAYVEPASRTSAPPSTPLFAARKRPSLRQREDRPSDFRKGAISV